MLYLFLILILIAFLAFKFIWKPYQTYKWYASNFRKQGYKVLEIPFNPFGNGYFKVYDFSPNTEDAMKYVKETYPDYDVAVLNVLNKVVVFIMNPDLQQQFFAADKLPLYEKSRLRKEGFVWLGGTGLIMSQGKQWKMKRKVLNAVFNFDFIKSQIPKVIKICDSVLDKVEANCEGGEIEYNVDEFTSELAGNVMFECFFGSSFAEDKIGGMSPSLFIKKFLDDMFLMTFEMPFFIFGAKFLDFNLREKDRRLNNSKKIFRSWGSKIVKDRVQEIQAKLEKGELNQSPKDIIEATTKNSLKEKKEDEMTYTNDDLLYQFITFFGAGVDTTSKYLNSMIYILAKHPEIEKKVREEIQEYMKDDDYSYENLKKMTYIDNVQKEVTRYYGPVNQIFAREVQDDHYLKGIPIKKGATIGVEILGVNYSEKYYKNPKEFRP